MTIWADFCEYVYYSSILNTLKWSSDCIRGWKSELCYESVVLSEAIRVFFGEESDDCVDVWFSRNCFGCTNCIGCVNLRGAKNCIFNVEYSPEEYQEKLKEMKLDTWNGINETLKKAHKFWRNLALPRISRTLFQLECYGRIRIHIQELERMFYLEWR